MFVFKKIVTPFLLPPGLFITVLVAIGICAHLRKNRRAASCTLITAAMIWFFSLAPLADWLMRGLESEAGIPPYADADVILMLGGSLYDRSPDLSGTGAPGPGSMDRMVTAARLHRRLGIPIIVSGGRVFRTGGAVATVTKRFLIDLGIPPGMIIVEDRSRDTYENALYCKAICERNGFTAPLMVTSGYHIKRAKLSFDKVGLDVTPFPCEVTTWPQKKMGWHGLLPSVGALYRSYVALHEWLGLLYYKLRY